MDEWLLWRAFSVVPRFSSVYLIGSQRSEGRENFFKNVCGLFSFEQDAKCSFQVLVLQLRSLRNVTSVAEPVLGCGLVNNRHVQGTMGASSKMRAPFFLSSVFFFFFSIYTWGQSWPVTRLLQGHSTSFYGLLEAVPFLQDLHQVAETRKGLDDGWKKIVSCVGPSTIAARVRGGCPRVSNHSKARNFLLLSAHDLPYVPPIDVGTWLIQDTQSS
jgi:hypothetical protein